MRLGNTRSPSLEEVLRSAVHQGLFDLHTALPGRVEKYDPTTQKADVKPLLKRTVINDDGTELSEALPVITDVPILFPRAGGFFISFPVQPGDYVLLVFCERSIDRWVAGQGAEADPVDLRMHDISDAVAFPAFYPFAKSLADASGSDLVMGQDKDGLQIAIKDGGALDITFSQGPTLHIESSGGGATLALGDGAVHVAIAEALQTLWSSLKSALDTWGSTHTHVCASPGSPSGIPVPVMSTPSWSAGVASDKMSIPDNGAP